MVLTFFQPAKALLPLESQCNNLMGNRNRLTSKKIKVKSRDHTQTFWVRAKTHQDIPWCKNSPMEMLNLTVSISSNLRFLIKLRWGNPSASSEALANSADGKNSSATWSGTKVTFGRFQAWRYRKVMKSFNTSMSFWTTIIQRDGSKASIVLLTLSSLQFRQVPIMLRSAMFLTDIRWISRSIFQFNHPSIWESTVTHQSSAFGTRD